MIRAFLVKLSVTTTQCWLHSLNLKKAMVIKHMISVRSVLFLFSDDIEFQPGVPWKGIQSSGDPESDPYMTPGSVLGSPGTPSLNDSDHQLLRDNIGIFICIAVC